jgi:hypothetical protein
MHRTCQLKTQLQTRDSAPIFDDLVPASENGNSRWRYPFFYPPMSAQVQDT